MSVDGNKQVYALVAVKQTQHCSLVVFLRDFVGAAYEYFVGRSGVVRVRKSESGGSTSWALSRGCEWKEFDSKEVEQNAFENEVGDSATGSKTKMLAREARREEGCIHMRRRWDKCRFRSLRQMQSIVLIRHQYSGFLPSLHFLGMPLDS
jgi:hypothetical protein